MLTFWHPNLATNTYPAFKYVIITDTDVKVYLTLEEAQADLSNNPGTICKVEKPNKMAVKMSHTLYATCECGKTCLKTEMEKVVYGYGTDPTKTDKEQEESGLWCKECMDLAEEMSEE